MFNHDPSSLIAGLMCLNRILIVILLMAICAIPLCGAAKTVLGDQNVSIPTMGYLEIRSTQEGARVYFDGNFMGHIANGTLKVPVDTHATGSWRDLILEYTGMNTYVGPLPEPLAGKTVAINVEMNTAGYQQMGIVDYKSSPPGAEIKIGNVSYGTSPDSGVLVLHTIPEGLYPFEVIHPGNLTERSTQIVNANAILTYEVILKPAVTGTLEIQSTPGNAEIFINNRYEGFSPLQIPDLPVGTHSMLVKHEGYQDWTGNVTVTGGSPDPVDVVLVSLPETPPCSPTPATGQRSPSPIAAVIGAIVIICGIIWQTRR